MVTEKDIERERIKELEAIAHERMSQDVIMEHLNKDDAQEYEELMENY